MLQKTCPICSKSFLTYKLKFCSPECFKKKITKECLGCGKSFEVYRSKSKSKFCSIGCYKTKIKKTCKRCGKVFDVYRSRIKQSNVLFCSFTCKRKDGINLGYEGVHKWLRYHYKIGDKCEFCNTSDKKITWANISHKYKQDRSDWIQLCYSCHKKYDLSFLNDNPELKHFSKDKKLDAWWV